MAHGGKTRGLVLLVGLALAGCSRPAEEKAAPPSQPQTTATVSLKTLDEHGLRKFLDEQRGRVVLVDFWATWCIPCRELLPHTVALHRRLADRGLVVITVSLDDPDKQSEARDFLAGKGADMANFISPYSTQQSFVKFAIPDGALPHLRLHDRRGKSRQTFDAKASAAEIESAVEKLLGEPS